LWLQNLDTLLPDAHFLALGLQLWVLGRRVLGISVSTFASESLILPQLALAQLSDGLLCLHLVTPCDVENAMDP
jgi:hypothetical protein